MRTRIPLIALAFLLLTPLVLPAQSPRPRVVDQETLLSRHLQPHGAIRPASLPAMRAQPIEIGEGRTVSLGTLTDAAFAEQKAFEGELRGGGAAGGTAAPPITDEAVYALPDAYAVVRSTKVTVVEPRIVSSHVQAYREFLDTGSDASVTLASLGPEARAGLDRFMRDEVASLPPQDPLAAAARQGPDALLRAISEGRGTFEITDTLVVPRTFPRFRGGRLEVPSIVDGRLDYSRGTALESLDPVTLVAEPNLTPPGPTSQVTLPPAQTPVYRESGRHDYQAAFLAGFTRGGTWEWERRWNYPSGFFRATFGAGYGLGLRIPIEVKGQMAPTAIAVKDRGDRPSSFHNRITARAFDAPASFYRAAGVPSSQVFGGREAVLEARVGFGCRLRVFWTNVVHIPYHERGVRLSQDGAPPFGGTGSMRIEIPASLTHTELDLGALKGYVKGALALTGDGEVRLEHEAIIDGHGDRKQTLVFRDGRPQDAAATLPLSSADATHRFGFTVARPVYRGELSLVPQVRLGMRVGYHGFSRGFHTRWISLNAARVDLGGVELGRQAGTRASYHFEGGCKRFERLQGRVADAERPSGTVMLQSAHSGRWVVVGDGPDALLQATATSPSQAARFVIVPLAQGRVALRTVNGRYVRGGLGPQSLLGASSEGIRAWETFDLVSMAGGRGALRSPRSGGYVRAGSGSRSFLSATGGGRIGAWETFRFVSP